MGKFVVYYKSTGGPGRTCVEGAWTVKRGTAEEAIGAVARDLAADKDVHSFEITNIKEEK